MSSSRGSAIMIIDVFVRVAHEKQAVDDNGLYQKKAMPRPLNW